MAQWKWKASTNRFLVGKLFPVWLGMGFGAGKAYGEAGELLTEAHDELLKRVGEEGQRVKSKDLKE